MYVFMKKSGVWLTRVLMESIGFKELGNEFTFK
jgi:hypothetical protein